MTTNHHTPLVGGQPATAGTFNAPLAQLDTAITDVITGATPLVDLNVTGDVNIGGTLDVIGAVKFDTNLQVTGPISGTTGTFSGDVSTTNATITGNVTAVNGNFTGDIEAVNGNFTGDVTAVDGTFTGDIEAVNGNFTGDVTAVNGNFTGDIEAVNGNFTGDVTAVDGTFTGIVTANALSLVGGISLDSLNISTSITLTIASGVVTATRTRHLIDTEASAAVDDLDTINGGVAGDILVLQSVNASRVVIVRHNTGNLRLNGDDVFLDTPRKVLTLLYDGTAWVLVAQPLPKVDRRQAYINWTDAAANYVGMGGLSQINANTHTISDQADGQYSNLTSTAVVDGFAGFWSGLGVYPHIQGRYNPSFTVWLRTGSNIAGMRLYIGFFELNPHVALDNLPATSCSGIGFRYSTVAGDTGLRPITSNGTTQTLGSAIGTLATNTAYKIRVWWYGGIAYFSINDSVPITSTTTLPTTTSAQTLVCRTRTTEAVAKSLLLKKVLLEFD